jgi:hypothetical protein
MEDGDVRVWEGGGLVRGRVQGGRGGGRAEGRAVRDGNLSLRENPPSGKVWACTPPRSL